VCEGAINKIDLIATRSIPKHPIPPRGQVQTVKGTINLTSKIPTGHWRLHPDSGATLTVGAGRHVFEALTNARPAPDGDVVMMNAHPETITHYGDLLLSVRDSATGEVKALQLRDVAYVPGSNYCLLSSRQYLDQLWQQTGRSGREPTMKTGVTFVKLPLIDGSLNGKVDESGLYYLDVVSPKHKALVTSAEKAADAGVILHLAKEAVRHLHRNFNHGCSLDKVKRMIREGDLLVHDRTVTRAILHLRAQDVRCESCLAAAQTKTQPKARTPERPEGQWEMDFATNMPPSTTGKTIVSVWVAPRKKGVYLGFHENKTTDEIYNLLKEKQRVWETDSGAKMKVLRTDDDRAFAARRFQALLDRRGIRHSVIHHKTRTGGSAVDSTIRHVQDKTKAVLTESGLPDRFWPEAMTAVNDSLDVVPGASGKSRFEERTGRKPNLKKRVGFGQTVFAYRGDAAKWGKRGREAIMLHMIGEGEGYRVLDPKTQTQYRADSITPLPADPRRPREVLTEKKGQEVGGADRTEGLPPALTWGEHKRPAAPRCH